MDDLIKALTIFRKYTEAQWPTHCEHDVMHVRVSPDSVSIEDMEQLSELGFNACSGDDDFQSYRFGGA